MIAELVIGAVFGVGVGLVVRALRRRGEAATRPGEEEGSPDDATATDDAPEPKKPRRQGPRGLQVGDVLLYADEELWLAGCVDVDEEGFAVRLFPTPGARRATWVAQLDAEAREVALLRETAAVPDGVVPESLPIDGMRLSLRRRGRGRISTEGEVPLVTEEARYVLLGGAAGRILVVLDFVAGDRLALSGERVTREMLELLPGGDAEG